MPRIIFISDTHGFEESISVPDGDILIYGGDFGSRSNKVPGGCGTLDELKKFHSWFVKLPHTHKIFIAGNHDFCFEREPDKARALLEGVHYLEDSSISIMSINFYGSPWQPRYFDWAFNLDRGKPIAEKWEKIPDDTDVLITHGPPHGILDKTYRGNFAGCEELLKRVKVIKPRFHLFGHIHEGYGQLESDGTTFVNGSICTLEYEPRNAPIVLSYE